MTDLHRGVARREREFFAGYYGGDRRSVAGDRLRWEREFRCLQRETASQGLGRVLSLGCGEGLLEGMLAGVSESVLGVDLSPEAIERAVARAAAADRGNLAFRCADVADFSWGEAYDTVVCIAFLHHWPEPELPELLSAAFRHLRPGGVFYSQDPNRGGALRALGRRVLGSRYHAYHSPDERELEPEELRRQLLAIGFSKVDVRYTDLTLIPAMLMFPSAPKAFFEACVLADRLWGRSPLARWASGFAIRAVR